MNGQQLMKSAGLNSNALLDYTQAIEREWHRAMENENGFYSMTYIKEKLQSIERIFQEIDFEKERLKRIEVQK